MDKKDGIKVWHSEDVQPQNQIRFYVIVFGSILLVILLASFLFRRKPATQTASIKATPSPTVKPKIPNAAQREARIQAAISKFQPHKPTAPSQTYVPPDPSRWRKGSELTPWYSGETFIGRAVRNGKQPLSRTSLQPQEIG